MAGHDIAAMTPVDDFSAVLIRTLLPVLRGHECLVLGRQEVGARLWARMRRLQRLALGARLLATLLAGQELVALVAVVHPQKRAALGMEAPGWVVRCELVQTRQQARPVVREEVLL